MGVLCIGKRTFLPSPDGLLATVAQATHQSQEPDEAGVHVQSAVACGITRKGPWRSSRTPGIQQALSNDYLKAEGLASLRDVWIRLYHSR